MNQHYPTTYIQDAFQVQQDAAKSILETHAKAYIANNPKVTQMFNRFALELIQAGRRHLGAKMIFERMRYETALKDDTEFKLNNNFVAYLARNFMKIYPQYEGYFETREKKS